VVKKMKNLKYWTAL